MRKIYEIRYSETDQYILEIAGDNHLNALKDYLANRFFSSVEIIEGDLLEFVLDGK
jgi:hypothetical protein